MVLCTLIGRSRWSAILWLGAAMVLAPAAAQESAPALERITDFNAELWIEVDGSLRVQEWIEVQSAEIEIRRGIIRDFPTDRVDRFGNQVTAGFEVVSVTRNGHDEPYRVERAAHGVRVYIGAEDVFIPPDHHLYLLTYRTDNQIGFFDDFDELYWPVTGDNWEFEIERATALIHLPAGAAPIGHAGSTGRAGEPGGDFTFADRGDGLAWFEATRALAPGEGLTVAVSWPPGLVTRPPRDGDLQRWLGGNWIYLAWLAGLALLGAFILVVGMQVGGRRQ